MSSQPQPRYLIFNKPYGVLSQFTDEGTGHPTLKNYISVPGVYAAGRLDRDSEGLLLLTNDGGLIKRLTATGNHTTKNYWIQVEGEYSAGKLTQLQNGLVLKEYQALPCRAVCISEPDLMPRSKPVAPHGPTFWLSIELREGKKRQIRHMTAAVGWFTLRLVRWAIGGLTLADLEPGAWRELSREQIGRIWTDLPESGWVHTDE